MLVDTSTIREEKPSDKKIFKKNIFYIFNNRRLLWGKACNE